MWEGALVLIEQKFLRSISRTRIELSSRSGNILSSAKIVNGSSRCMGGINEINKTKTLAKELSIVRISAQLFMLTISFCDRCSFFLSLLLSVN